MSHFSHHELHLNNSNTQLNWLRAAVLGANDGIVSVASIIFGVAGATANTTTILTAGFAGMFAGALSMAVGEYVSVSTQLDTEKALIKKEKTELKEFPQEELAELTEIYAKKGLSKETARSVAAELTKTNALKAHLEAELGIFEDQLTNPISAALASGTSFVCGAVIPLLFIIISPASYRIIFTLVSVLFALAITGYLSATAGGAGVKKAMFRVVMGGLFAMLVTYAVGLIFGTVIS